jgi:glucans biosynthesis protein C
MEKKLKRLVYIDNLRLLMIIFVVMIHCAVTYSGFGSWYYKEGAGLDTFSTVVFGYSMTFTLAYILGFLFLVAGFFTPGAYDKKGFKKFIKDRFIRLGIPTLIFMLIINPFTDYVLMGSNWSVPRQAFREYYWSYLSSFRFLGETGPLWFAFALLIFSCIYALVRLIRGATTAKQKVKELKPFKIVLLIFLISAGSFCVRLVQPIGNSILNMQLSNFPQYIILFITGLFAYRNNWFSSIQNILGKKGLIFTIIGGFIPWSIIMIGGGAINGLNFYKGGMNWQSATFALWESFISVSMTIGLISLFREKFNYQNKLTKMLSDNAFAVYVFHTPIIIFLSFQLKSVVLPPLIKFLILSTIGVTVCFTITYFIIKRIPLLKKVI